MTHSILIIEDDSSMRTGLIDNLEFEGYQLLCADNGMDGLRMAREEQLDLVLLDLMLPQMDGVTLCRQLRESGNQTPVIMLTARSQEIDKVVGLEVGADDYMTKPFSVRELLARIRSQIRRAEMPEQSNQHFTVGNTVINFEAHMLETDQQRYQLSQGESEILKILMTHRGQVVTRDEFIATIQDGKRFSNTRALDNCMVRLRRKLEKDPAHPRYLLTVHGLGYKLIN